MILVQSETVFKTVKTQKAKLHANSKREFWHKKKKTRRWLCSSATSAPNNRSPEAEHCNSTTCCRVRTSPGQVSKSHGFLAV